MNFIIPCFFSFLLTATIMPLVIRWATASKCLDLPGERRVHKKVIPLWGGTAFFAGVLPILFIENSGGTLTAYICASLLLVGMGMLDDRTALSWQLKFTVITVATAIVIFGGNISIQQIGVFGDWGQIELGIFSIPFTFFCIIGITNAINLLDGLDGLAGGVALLAFLFIGIAAHNSGNETLAIICFAFVGGLAAFLPFNFPHARIFMGDTGSIFLGFSLAIAAIMLTQGSGAQVNALFPVLLLLIPIFDTIWVLQLRLKLGRNPFKGDNLHLHYLMAQTGQTPISVVLQLWGITLLLGSIALSMNGNTAWPYLVVMLYTTGVLVCFVIHLARPHLLRDLKSVEVKKSVEVRCDVK